MQILILIYIAFKLKSLQFERILAEVFICTVKKNAFQQSTAERDLPERN